MLGRCGTGLPRSGRERTSNEGAKEHVEDTMFAMRQNWLEKGWNGQESGWILHFVQAMGDEREPRYPVETGDVEWTPAKLRDRTAERERLLVGPGRAADSEVESVRSLLEAELETKRDRLVVLHERG